MPCGMRPAVLSVMAQTPDDGSGLENLRPGPFIALMVVGFLIGVAGHLTSSRTLVATGIGMIFLATLLLPVAIKLFA